MKSVSVVIPTYNGRQLLEKNLPHLIAARDKCGSPVEIIIVDDASTDDTVEFLNRRYPGIKLLRQNVNAGFAEAMNRGIMAAEGSIMLALNNDIVVGDDLFTRSLHWFDNPDVFSVTPLMIDPRTGRCQSLTRVKPGIAWFATRFLQPEEMGYPKGGTPIFFGSGGGSFYQREKLMQLGGFDPIYSPFYVEDQDISYQAWKAGWKCIFDPEVTIFHETSSTILSIHRKRKIKFIGDRNRTLFLWLNISDPFLIARYFLFLPFSLLYDIVAVRKYKFVGFFWALTYLPRIPRLRRKRMKNFRVRDREVIENIRWA